MVLLLSCKNKVEKIKPLVETVSESVYASGTVKSKNQYQAFAAVSGIIEQVFVSEGDTVKKGSPLLSISSEVQKLSKENAELAAAYADMGSNLGKLEEARLAIELSRSRMRNDSAMFFRQKSLWEQQVGTKAELELRELAYQAAKNNYQMALLQFADLKKQLDFSSSQSKKNLQISGRLEAEYTLRSEVDGIVYSLLKKKGEIVGPQTAIAVLGASDHFVLELQVDEYDILKVRKGLSVLLSLDSYKGKVFEARVSKINPLMNERSKTFTVEAEFVQQPEVLYPNVSFEANIVLQTKPNALLIPRNYLVNDSIVIKSDGQRVPVKTGLKDYRKIEILSGITAADELIKPEE